MLVCDIHLDGSLEFGKYYKNNEKKCFYDDRDHIRHSDFGNTGGDGRP